MPRPKLPNGPADGTAVWVDRRDRDLLFALAKIEDRSVKSVVSRALAEYADRSPDWQLHLQYSGGRRRNAAAARATRAAKSSAAAQAG